MDQAYAGLVPELLGIQKYPDAFLDSDGIPKTLPYDVTGWTLPLQLGVVATEIKDKIDPAEAKKLAPLSEARQVGSILGEGTAYALSRRTNASYLLPTRPQKRAPKSPSARDRSLPSMARSGARSSSRGSTRASSR